MNQNSFSVKKNSLLLFKFIFQVICLCILFYQFIGITNDYLNFPYDVKLNVKDNHDLSFSSVTFCLKSVGFWRIKNFENKGYFCGNKF